MDRLRPSGYTVRVGALEKTIFVVQDYSRYPAADGFGWARQGKPPPEASLMGIDICAVSDILNYR